jgi:arylsulfatase
MNSYKWELYDLAKDWTQDNDLAASNPTKLKEMQGLFMVEAAKYQVFPLDNSLATRMVTPRPSVTAGRNVFTYAGELTGIPMGDAPQLLNTSYTITVEVEIPETRALGLGAPQTGDGMIATQGGRFAGWGFYILKGKPVYVWNLLDLKRVRWKGPEPLSPGQAHAGVRLQVRRARLRHSGLQQHERHRSERHGRAEGGWQGRGNRDDGTHDSYHLAVG